MTFLLAYIFAVALVLMFMAGAQRASWSRDELEQEMQQQADDLALAAHVEALVRKAEKAPKWTWV